MKNAVISIIMGFVSLDTVSKVLAMCVVRLLELARRKGGNTWNQAKKVLAKTENWISLFNEVYDDDELSEADEEKIRKAIANLTVTKRITTILKQKD